MGRRYTREQYLTLFDKIKEKIPDCTVTTILLLDSLVKQMNNLKISLSLYEHCEYDLAYTFIYSPREGTPAAKMEDDIDIHNKEQTLYRLNDIVNEKALKQNQKYLGQVVNVLVEGISKKDDSMLSGYTAHQKLINFKGNKDHIGKIVPVKVLEVKTWALKGEEIE